VSEVLFVSLHAVMPTTNSACIQTAVCYAVGVVLSGRRFHLEILESLCFPSALKLPQQDASAAADAATPGPANLFSNPVALTLLYGALSFNSAAGFT
jgi:hypothetical protein